MPKGDDPPSSKEGLQLSTSANAEELHLNRTNHGQRQPLDPPAWMCPGRIGTDSTDGPFCQHCLQLCTFQVVPCPGTGPDLSEVNPYRRTPSRSISPVQAKPRQPRAERTGCDFQRAWEARPSSVHLAACPAASAAAAGLPKAPKKKKLGLYRLYPLQSWSWDVWDSAP